MVHPALGIYLVNVLLLSQCPVDVVIVYACLLLVFWVYMAHQVCNLPVQARFISNLNLVQSSNKHSETLVQTS